MTEIEKVEPSNISTAEFSPDLTSLACELSIDMSLDIDSRMNRAVDKTNQALRLVVEAGIDFISVKAELSHGEFEDFLNERGVAKQRASEAMMFAKILASRSEKDRKDLYAMSKTKALMIARTEKEVIEQLMQETDSENLTELNELSFRDMRDRIRKLELQNADLQVEQETKNLTIRTLNDRASQRRNFNAEYPDYVNVTRDEGNALSTEIALRIDELDRIVTDLSELPGVTDQKMLSLAVTNLQIHLKATAARACQLTKKLSDTFGDLVTELGGEHLLTPAEIEQAVMDRNTMTQEMEQQKRIREDRRENAKPRKPGRPKSK